MATEIEKKIYRRAAACGVLAALALVVPRFARNSEGGFASGATAVVVLLLMLVATAIVSLYLLTVTVRTYRDISPLARLAGIAPSVVTVGAVLLLLILLRY